MKYWFLIVLFLISTTAFAQDSYIQYLNKLDRNDINSISLAVSKLGKIGSNYSASKYDEIYFKFEEFCYEVINKVNENLSQKMHEKLDNYPEDLTKVSYNKVQDKEIKNLLILLNKNYCELNSTEGTYFIDLKADAMKKIFASKTSNSLKEFITIRDNEQKERFFEDAILMISFEKLGQRIITWENFIKKYPKAKITKDAEYFYYIYLGTFMQGLDNTRILDDEDKLLPKMITVYENFVKRYPTKRSAKIVSDYLKIFKKNSYKLNQKEIMPFLKANKIPQTQGMQLHLR